MSFGNIDVISSWKHLNFTNSKSTLVTVAAMKKKGYMHQDLPSVWLIEVQC